MYQYACLQASEGGNPFRWLSEQALKELLTRDPEDYDPRYLLAFVGPDRLKIEDDPQYWDLNEIMLLRVEILEPKPVTLVKKWTL